MSEKRLVLYSGGLDSTIALLLTIEAGFELFYPVYIVRKGWATSRELETAKAIAIKLGLGGVYTMQAPNINYGKKLSGRDTIYLTALAPKIAIPQGCKVIVYGEEANSDRYNPEDIEGRVDEQEGGVVVAANQYFRNNNIDLQVESPICRDIKVDMIRRYKTLFEKYNISPLDTYSCWYFGKDKKECGRCEHCFRQYMALRNGGYTRQQLLEHFANDPLAGHQSEKLRGMLEYSYQRKDWATYVEITETLAIVRGDKSGSSSDN